MFLLIDKVKGMTSHDVVDRVRKITGEKRVGHGGTLDPNASGLLILGVGRESTRELGKISRKTTKTYSAEIRLGEERSTDDSEGFVTQKSRGVLPPSKTEVRSVLPSFKGKQKQVPPQFSAIKIKGKKAYELARKGKRVKLKPREIEVFRIKLLQYKYPILKIEVEVSSGTYIRALARDIGRRLGCGGYLKELRRTEVGKYKIEKAVTLEEFKKKFS
jgi:tRNA pseudouridine55 synthase